MTNYMYILSNIPISKKKEIVYFLAHLNNNRERINSWHFILKSPEDLTE